MRIARKLISTGRAAAIAALLACFVAPAAGTAADWKVVEVFSTALELPGSGLQSPQWLFASAERGEILAVGVGLLNPDGREVAWFLWKVDAQGKVLKQEIVTAKTIGESVVLIGCILNRNAEGVCLADGKGDELVSVRVPFDGSARITARATIAGFPGTKLESLVKMSEGRFIGLGSRYVKPFAIVFDANGQVSWALTIPVEHQGRIDSVLEGQEGALVLSGVAFALEKPAPSVPFLVRVDKAGRVLGEKRLERLEGRAVITLGQGPAGATSAELASDLSAVKTVDFQAAFGGILPEPRTTVGSEWVVFLRSKEARPELVLLNDEGVEMATRLFPDLIYSPGARLASSGNDSFFLLSPETPMKAEGGVRRGMRLMLFRIAP